MVRFKVDVGLGVGVGELIVEVKNSVITKINPKKKIAKASHEYLLNM